jgi:hypothetical protein
MHCDQCSYEKPFLSLLKNEVMARKKIGSIDYTPFVLLGALGIGAYFLWSKLFPGGSGAAQNEANNAAITASTQGALQSDIATLQSQGATQTISNAEASGIASQLYDLGISGNPVPQANQDKMQNLIIQVNSQLDYDTIAQYFGTKNANTGFSFSNLFGSNNTSYDLAAWLGATLDAAHLATVDQFFSAQGISAYV